MAQYNQMKPWGEWKAHLPECIVSMIEDQEYIGGEEWVYSPFELFKDVLEYEGIIGYTDMILGTIKEIYGVDLRR